MISISKSRLVASAATIALAAGGIGVGVASAGASTAACITTGPLAGSCGDLATASGHGLAVRTDRHGRASAGDQIVASTALTSSTATDFYAHQTNGSVSERVLEYAPGGVESGLYVTASWGGLTLQRHSRDSASQEFYGIGDTQNDTSGGNGGLQWLSASTGKVIVINGGRVSLDSLAGSSYGSGTYLHWVG